MLPAMGPAVVQLPTAWQTRRLPVAALPSSSPVPTDVISVNDASVELSSPLSPSLAVHAIATLSPCHKPSAALQCTTGGATSGGGLFSSIPASTQSSNPSGRFAKRAYTVSTSTASMLVKYVCQFVLRMPSSLGMITAIVRVAHVTCDTSSPGACGNT